MAPPLQGTNAALSRRVTVWDDLDLSSIVQKKKKKKESHRREDNNLHAASSSLHLSARLEEFIQEEKEK